MTPLNLLILIAVHGLAVSAVITWIYDTNLLAELSNILPGKRPEMFLRQDFDDWLMTTPAPGWLQALLSCWLCGTAHAAFWLTAPMGILWITQTPDALIALVFWGLLWLGSAGFTLALKQHLKAN